MTSGLRIRPIPPRMALCAVCRHVIDCVAYDHDLRGDICAADQTFVVQAEVNLRNAGLAIPTSSIMEDGGPESGCL